jgi:hypothetical protein
MKKGIIMEIKSDILVMMTSEGEFLTGRKQPNQKYDIGEEIPFFPMRNEPASAKRFVKWNWKVSTALLTSIIVILTLFSSAFLQSNQAYAYVSVDINPSMELTLNEKQQVIKITPYNQDAKLLLEELDGWGNMDVSEVTEEIFFLCEEMGFLKENQNVLITSSFIEDSNDQREDDLVAEINKFVQEFSTDHNMNITVKETSQEMREEASDKGMTAGSLLRETEKAETPKSLEDTKREKKDEDVLNEGIKKEKSSKVENQKVELPSVEKKQKPEGTENLQKNDKNHSNQKKDPEKPVQTERKNNTSDYQHRDSNGHSNRDKDNYRGNAKWHNPKNSKEENERDQDRKEEKKRNHNDWNEEKKRDHQDRKDEKKKDHQERKDNRKYKDD